MARKQQGPNLDEFILALVNKCNEQEIREANDKSHGFWEKSLRGSLSCVCVTVQKAIRDDGDRWGAEDTIHPAFKKAYGPVLYINPQECQFTGAFPMDWQLDVIRSCDFCICLHVTKFTTENAHFGGSLADANCFTMDKARSVPKLHPGTLEAFSCTLLPGTDGAHQGVSVLHHISKIPQHWDKAVHAQTEMPFTSCLRVALLEWEKGNFISLERKQREVNHLLLVLDFSEEWLHPPPTTYGRYIEICSDQILVYRGVLESSSSKSMSTTKQHLETELLHHTDWSKTSQQVPNILMAKWVPHPGSKSNHTSAPKEAKVTTKPFGIQKVIRNAWSAANPVNRTADKSILMSGILMKQIHRQHDGDARASLGPSGVSSMCGQVGPKKVWETWMALEPAPDPFETEGKGDTVAGPHGRQGLAVPVCPGEADKGQIQLELCSQGPVKPSEAPLCRITFLTGMSLKSPRRWSLTAPDSTKDTPDRCLHGILQHFKRELVVLIMVVV
ncbi:hypothetical protein Anapl_12988 [Anas platyrhynchos]|uniref:Uncharacterized protein n=1 Tax=Anas platyrhynchos TaxID=8839 RepID=R0JSD4_ANAPL|nr:hypothetical protein Anapl_12988 [Anas platyrhynchos]